MIRLACPRCGLTMTPRVSWLAMEHCPRCLGRNRVAVELRPAGLADNPHERRAAVSSGAATVGHRR